MQPAVRNALLFAALATGLSAQSAPAPSGPFRDATAAAANADKTATAPAPAAAAQKRSDEGPRRTRVISPEAAAALAANAPKFAPPPPPPEKKPEEELPDLRETDKPKNGIIRLPKYVVQERKPAVFTERDINTQKGLAELAKRRYLSQVDQALNRFYIPFISQSNDERALSMYSEDERLQKMSDFADRANMVQKSDAASGLYIKREVDKTFQRPGDFGWQKSDPRK